jgi:hypothetical protein
MWFVRGVKVKLRIIDLNTNNTLQGKKKPTKFFARSFLIALMMEAESTSETSVNFYHTTRRNIPEDSHLPFKCFKILVS